MGNAASSVIDAVESVGGQCDDSGAQRSKPKTLEKLADYQINETISYEGCVPNIGGGQSGSGLDRFKGKNSCGDNCYPKNGEFQWAGLGESCRMCSGAVTGYGCDCSSDDAGMAVGGRRPTIKRIAYKGDVGKCCETQAKTEGNFTCDPAAQKQNGRVSDYCMNSEFQRCSKDLDSVNPNFETESCQTFINNMVTDGNSMFDETIRTYCKTRGKYLDDNTTPNPKYEPRCDCINPPKNIDTLRREVFDENAVGDIVCWYDKCKTNVNPYITSTQTHKRNSCNYTNCIIKDVDVSLTDGGSAGLIDVKNDCGPKGKETIEEQKRRKEEQEKALLAKHQKKLDDKTKEKRNKWLLLMTIICIILMCGSSCIAAASMV